jgi:hypothetical protein
MTRRALRLWTGALLLASVLLLPQAGTAQGLSLSEQIETRSGLALLWDLLGRLFQAQDGDPDGSEATPPQPDNRGTIDPNG